MQTGLLLMCVVGGGFTRRGTIQNSRSVPHLSRYVVDAYWSGVVL